MISRVKLGCDGKVRLEPTPWLWVSLGCTDMFSACRLWECRCAAGVWVWPNLSVCRFVWHTPVLHVGLCVCLSGGCEMLDMFVLSC